MKSRVHIWSYSILFITVMSRERLILPEKATSQTFCEWNLWSVYSHVQGASSAESVSMSWRYHAYATTLWEPSDTLRGKYSFAAVAPFANMV